MEDDRKSDDSVVREDKYHINICGLVVVANSDQETRIRMLDAEQQARFKYIMGG